MHMARQGARAALEAAAVNSTAAAERWKLTTKGAAELDARAKQLDLTPHCILLYEGFFVCSKKTLRNTDPTCTPEESNIKKERIY